MLGRGRCVGWVAVHACIIVILDSLLDHEVRSRMPASAASAHAARERRKGRAASGAVEPSNSANKGSADEQKWILPRQQWVNSIYNHKYAQQFVALLIILNFATNIVEKEIDPPMGEVHWGQGRSIAVRILSGMFVLATDDNQ